jgi:hypothetical protein
MAADDSDHPARAHWTTLNAAIGTESQNRVNAAHATAAHVRAMFWAYCVVIVAGLSLYAAVGLIVE